MFSMGLNIIVVVYIVLDDNTIFVITIQIMVVNLWKDVFEKFKVEVYRKLGCIDPSFIIIYIIKFKRNVIIGFK